MFGYVKPQPPELLVKEYELYKATYCGICRAMKRHCGTLSPLTLNYDSVLLALVRMLYIGEEPIAAAPARCIAHPFKKRPMLKENSALVYTARAFSLLAFHKLDDDAYDERLVRRLAASVAKCAVRRATLGEDTRQLSQIAIEKLTEIRRLEGERCESPDIPASLFGDLLGAIFSFGLYGNDALVTRTLGFHLGRFIFCADAAEDFERDVKSGAYNPYVLSYGKELTEENRATIKRALLVECTLLSQAVELLPFEKSKTIENIIKNIIYKGLVNRISFLDEVSKGETK